MFRNGVIVLFNHPHVRAHAAGGQWHESDAGVMREVEAVSSALKTLGIAFRLVGVRRLADVPGLLAAGDETIVFNLVETLAGDPSDMVFVPAVCRAMGKSATGCGSDCQSLCQDKWQMKAVLRAHGLPTSPGVLVPKGDAVPALDPSMFPVIVKPAAADGSEGIDNASVVAAPGEDLAAAIRRLHEQFDQPALIEPFVSGKEINISLLQRGDRVEVLPLAEIDFSAFPPGQPRIVGYAAKWLPDSFEYRNTPRRLPAAVSEETADALRRCALDAWRALNCSDYARVDCRLNDAERPYILEVNSNPDIAPDAGFAAALHAAGIPYDQFVRAVLDNASMRLDGIRHGFPVATVEASEQGVPEIRPSIRSDIEPIVKLVTDSGFFRPDEVAIAREVLDDALGEQAGDEFPYETYTAAVAGQVAGWICFGPAPCTVGTYDIYWIVVAADRRRAGIGSAMLQHAEALIARHGGHLVAVDTSSRPLYEFTRRFYERNGYGIGARIPDFYAPGDDKVIFTKRLN